MKFKTKCVNCGHAMRSDRWSGLVVHSCLFCHRVMVVGGPGDVAVGDMFDARMKAQGYHRTL